MNPAFGAEEQAFREQVSAFLADYRELDGFHFQGSKWPRVRALYRACSERGWLALGWPEAAGGRPGGAVYEFILWDEMAYARAARPPLGAGIVAKTIVRHGTAAQQARWLPPIRDAEIFFSLGYSEPQAGSDLARLRTMAVRRGDRYVLAGEKCWTSYAQDSDYLWTLCRTGEAQSGSEGLSLLIVDLRAPGVGIRPLPMLDGERLNQVHFADVEVPVEHRIGPENGAWALVREALATERHVQFPPGRLRRDLEDVIAWLRAAGRADDPVVRARLAELAVEVLEAETLALRVLETVVKGERGTALAAANKLVGAELCQKIARTAADLGGPEALVAGSPIEFLWRQTSWETIGGGTSEIMRSVIAREGLELPWR